jgi:hypothetical protein
MADDNENPDDKFDASRRRLIRMAIYTPPIVIGIMQLQNTGCAPASCSPVSCNPNSQCAPNTCNPVINPCGPQNCNPAN